MGCTKVVLRGKIIALNMKKKRPQINNLSLHLTELEKEEQTKLKLSRRKKIIKIRAEINEIKNRKTIEKMNQTKSWFFEKIKLTNP